MDNRKEAFSPENVDERIERLMRRQTGGRGAQTSAAQLIKLLQNFYEVDPRIQRVREKLAARMSAVSSVQKSDFSQTEPSRRFMYTESTQHVHKPERAMWRYLGVIAACLVAIVIVGSLVIMLSYRDQQEHTVGAQSINNGSGKTATATPTALDFSGRTLYRAPTDTRGLTWSPDSRRVASIKNNTVQIWDATTGNHLITVQMSSGDEWPDKLAWSANGQQIAIATDQHVLLVNGQTGQIELSYSGKKTAQADTHVHMAMRAASGRPPLVSLLPASGGFGFHSTAWSPDGHAIASAVAYGANGDVEVWNPRTGAFLFGLRGGDLGGDSYSASSVAWSFDGQYIAAMMFDQQGGSGPNNGRVVVWSAKTHQIVFYHDDYLQGLEPVVVWQPQSHNIVFGGGSLNTTNNIVSGTLEIWNGVTGKLVKQYAGEGNGVQDWSPDGRYIAYVGDSEHGKENAVHIMEVTTGKNVYVYAGDAGDQRQVNVIAWSPDGRYIASIADDVNSGTVASVWAVH